MVQMIKMQLNLRGENLDMTRVTHGYRDTVSQEVSLVMRPMAQDNNLLTLPLDTTSLELTTCVSSVSIINCN